MVTVKISKRKGDYVVRYVVSEKGGKVNRITMRYRYAWSKDWEATHSITIYTNRIAVKTRTATIVIKHSDVDRLWFTSYNELVEEIDSDPVNAYKMILRSLRQITEHVTANAPE